MDDSMKIGPAGYEGDKIWDHKGQSQLVQMFVSFGPNYLKSLRFQYVENGRLVTSEIIGKQHFSDTTNFETFTLDYPSEYITMVSGHYNRTYNYIEELTIMTNTTYKVTGKTFKPDLYRPSQDAVSFKFVLGKLNQFGGFHGSHDKYGVRSIGVYVNPIKALPDATMKFKHTQDEDDTQQVAAQGI